MRTRNKAIDILKVMGVTTIMLSHCQGMPYVVNYFRNYEVILLVMVSGMLYKGYEQETLSWTYIKKRLSRIVVPTWSFLTIFLVLLFAASKVLHIPFPYSVRDIVESYTMTNGIGYVWIMLVYCFIALGLPLIWIIYNKTRNKAHHKVLFSVCLVVIWIAYEVIRWKIDGTQANNIPVYIFKNTLLYFVAYSIIAWIGSYLGRKNAFISLLVGIILTTTHFVIVGVMASVTTESVSLSTMKYPPSLVYVLYGMGISLIFIGCIRMLCGNDETKSKLIAFISEKSQWVYFNHVYMVFIWNQVIGTENWFVCFVLYTIGSVMLTWIQVFIITYLFGKRTDRFSLFIVRTFT